MIFKLLTAKVWSTGSEFGVPPKIGSPAKVGGVGSPGSKSGPAAADAGTSTGGLEVRRISIESWLAGPGASLPAPAREVLVAMFRAYDDGGLVGDPATAILLVIGIGVATVVVTLLYVRLTGGRHS